MQRLPRSLVSVRGLVLLCLEISRASDLLSMLHVCACMAESADAASIPAAPCQGVSQVVTLPMHCSYCGTACSHADWRAGHRRVCKALGAARQQQRQQGSKPRRTADAGAEEHCWPGSGFALFGLKM